MLGRWGLRVRRQVQPARPERDYWVRLVVVASTAVLMAAGLGYLMSKWAGAIGVGSTTLGLMVLAGLAHLWFRRRPFDAEEGWRRLSRWGYVAGLGSGGWNPRVPELKGRKAEGDGLQDNDGG